MCSMYHPYVRPSTADIVERLYPKRNGDRAKVYPSGAMQKGTVVNEVFQVSDSRAHFTLLYCTVRYRTIVYGAVLHCTV